MRSLSGDEPSAVGLRERKKARTRAAIREHALRLFREQGYEATTVEQIAEAAEVSPSTFFRYFPTKEDVVLVDDYDPLLIEAFKAQPPELSAIAALRASMRAVFGALPAEQMAQERERMLLIRRVPQLQAGLFEGLASMIQMVAEVVAERAGRSTDELAVRTLAGALVGVEIAAALTWADDPETDMLALADAALAHLEAGLPL
jgi:AcrR family transcriptional regulator